MKEADARAAQLSRGDMDAMQISGKDRLIYGRALEAVKAHGLPLDASHTANRWRRSVVILPCPPKAQFIGG
jgi:hypothetical protein